MHDDIGRIRLLEELSLNACPAEHTLYYDGWQLRFNGNYSRRANSVQSLYPSTLNLGEKIAHCERLCAARGTPAIFKLTAASQPDDLDARLDSDGYRREGATKIQTCQLDLFDLANARSMRIEPTLSEEWLQAYVTLNGVERQQVPSLRGLLNRIVPAHGFGSIELDGVPVAAGLVVMERGHASLWDIVVDSAQRRKGLGTALVNELLLWAHERGAHTAFLAVVEENVIAQRLYAKLGFRDVYTYWYRAKRT